LCGPYHCTTSVARYWYPELARAVIERNRTLKRSISRKHEQSLERLGLDIQLVLKAEAIGWHKVEAELSEEFEAPIHRVRKRLAHLKRDLVSK